MFKLNSKSDADSLPYSLRHFECDGHTVHMLTQQHLPPPLTGTVKSSLFTHVHSSPLSLAARLHWCHVNHSSWYVNNDWTFSGQTLYVTFPIWVTDDCLAKIKTCSKNTSWLLKSSSEKWLKSLLSPFHCLKQVTYPLLRPSGWGSIIAPKEGQQIFWTKYNLPQWT